MKRILLINILTTVLLSIGMGIGGWLLGTTHAQENSGVILACVDSLTGSVRIVAAHSECKPSESGTQWNVQGGAGSAVLSGYELIYEIYDVFPGSKPNFDGTHSATCPEGKLPVGGGFRTDQEIDIVEVVNSYPYENKWYVSLNVKNFSRTVHMSVYAICAYVEN